MAQHSSLSRDSRDEGRSVLDAARSRPVDPGRLGVYAAFGASIGVVPIPWLPAALVRRLRGALVHDVAARHGVSLSRDAREILAEPAGPGGPRSLFVQAVRFVGTRVALRALAGFGPLAAVWPLRGALQIYLLGHLFDRYLELERTERAVRIDIGEARRIRAAIDGAFVRALTIETPSSSEPTPVDDQRDASTAFVDAVFGLAAGLPGRAMVRLEAAFDELVRARG